MLSRLPVIASFAVALAACHPPEAPPGAQKPAPGAVHTVALRVVDDLKPVPATRTTYKVAEATARLSGILTDLRVRDGDMVRRGQVIGRVEDGKIGQQTRAYDAQAVAADARAAQAKLQYNRVRTLTAKGIYAQAALDQAEADYKAAEAGARAAHAQVAASGAYGNDGIILSPDDGRILHAPVPKGAVVMAGQSIATVTAGAPIVRIELPEAQGRDLKPGDTVRLTAGQRSVTAAVTQVYPSAVHGQMIADADAAGFEDLPVGARLTAYVRLGQRQAILLPRTCVQTRYGLDYVA